MSKRPAEGSSITLELKAWVTSVSEALSDLRGVIQKGKESIRPLELPPLPGVATREAVSDLFHCLLWLDPQEDVINALREHPTAGPFFIFDQSLAMECLVSDGTSGRVKDAHKRLEVFKRYFGKLAPEVAEHTAGKHSNLWRLLTTLGRMPGYANADHFMRPLLFALLDHCVYPKEETAAYLILWERAFFSERHGTPSQYEMTRAVAETVVCGYLLGHTDPDAVKVNAEFCPAAWAVYWGAVIIPLRVGDLSVNSLNFLPKAEHVTKERATEDPEYFHTEGDCKGCGGGTCVKQDELCFDRAIALLAGRGTE